ncbi:MAG: SCP2 sterol-binding domain-containing protein [Clostridiales bacterium]|nr:SCP2 sterol-binding domain-containing protein [Clostridiales bacterium]
MEFYALVDWIRSCLRQADVSHMPGVTAFELRVSGRRQGTFYIEIKDGRISAEPYEYCDRNAILILSDRVLEHLFRRRFSLVEAICAGMIQVEGRDAGAVLELIPILRQINHTKVFE